MTKCVTCRRHRVGEGTEHLLLPSWSDEATKGEPMQDQQQRWVNASLSETDYSALVAIASQDANETGAVSINLSATLRRLIRQESKRRFSDEHQNHRKEPV